MREFILPSTLLRIAEFGPTGLVRPWDKAVARIAEETAEAREYLRALVGGPTQVIWVEAVMEAGDALYYSAIARFNGAPATEVRRARQGLAEVMRALACSAPATIGVRTTVAGIYRAALIAAAHKYHQRFVMLQGKKNHTLERLAVVIALQRYKTLWGVVGGRR